LNIYPSRAPFFVLKVVRWAAEMKNHSEKFEKIKTKKKKILTSLFNRCIFRFIFNKN